MGILKVILNLYLESMSQIGASTKIIERFYIQNKNIQNLTVILSEKININPSCKKSLWILHLILLIPIKIM